MAKYIESEETRYVGFSAYQEYVVVWGPSSDDTMSIVFQKTKQKDEWFQRDDDERQRLLQTWCGSDRRRSILSIALYCITSQSTSQSLS